MYVFVCCRSRADNAHALSAVTRFPNSLRVRLGNLFSKLCCLPACLPACLEVASLFSGFLWASFPSLSLIKRADTIHSPPLIAKLSAPLSSVQPAAIVKRCRFTFPPTNTYNPMVVTVCLSSIRMCVCEWSTSSMLSSFVEVVFLVAIALPLTLALAAVAPLACKCFLVSLFCRFGS